MVKSADFVNALNHSIISPLCLVWVLAPHWAHVRQPGVLGGFLGVLPCSPQNKLVNAKPEDQQSASAQLISVFVFATQIVGSQFFLDSIFQASSLLLWLYWPVCVGSGRKPHCWFSQDETQTCECHTDNFSLTLVDKSLALTKIQTSSPRNRTNRYGLSWRRLYCSINLSFRNVHQIFDVKGAETVMITARRATAMIHK